MRSTSSVAGGVQAARRGHVVAAAISLVALGLEPVGQLRAALLDDPAVDEDVDEVRLDVAQDPRVVRDEQDADRRRSRGPG